MFNCGWTCARRLKFEECRGTLKRDVRISALPAWLAERVVAFVDRLGRHRGFRRLRTVPVLGGSIQNLHLVSHDFDSRALFASPVFPFPGLQPAF